MASWIYFYLALGQGDKLGAGKHSFPFQFMLPAVLPSSFEHQYGQVRYSLKATIDKPWKFDHTTKQMFTVVSMLDLNTIPEAPVITIFSLLAHLFLCIPYVYEVFTLIHILQANIFTLYSHMTVLAHCTRNVLYTIVW